MIRRTLTLAAVCASLLAVSTLRSQAAFTIGDWQATPSQTVGDTTWVLTSTSLPADLGVNFLTQDALRVQNDTGLLVGPASYTLDYTVSISGGLNFQAVAVDTTTPFGSSTLTKVINGGLTLTSVDGNPSAVTAIPGSPSMLTVHETLAIGAGGVVADFSNTYTVVPEPGTILVGALLLLPIGMSLIRTSRKDRNA